MQEGFVSKDRQQWGVHYLVLMHVVKNLNSWKFMIDSRIEREFLTYVFLSIWSQTRKRVPYTSLKMLCVLTRSQLRKNHNIWHRIQVTFITLSAFPYKFQIRHVMKASYMYLLMDACWHYLGRDLPPGFLHLQRRQAGPWHDPCLHAHCHYWPPELCKQCLKKANRHIHEIVTYCLYIRIDFFLMILDIFEVLIIIYNWHSWKAWSYFSITTNKGS